MSERDTRFDRFYLDPEAIEWARKPIEDLVAFTRRVAEGAEDPERAKMWNRQANFIEDRLLGGEGCVIRPFDRRRSELFKMVVESDGKPS